MRRYKRNQLSAISHAEGREFNPKLKKANVEADFYNIVDGTRSSCGGRVVVLDPSTEETDNDRCRISTVRDRNSP